MNIPSRSCHQEGRQEVTSSSRGKLDCPEQFVRNACLTLPMLRLLSSKHKDAKKIFENHLNPVLLVCIG